jgi:error-prone DNA polymerase
VPEHPSPKATLHPWRDPDRRGSFISQSAQRFTYCDLHVTSNFTFLTGASHPEELIRTAARLGHGAATITDRNSLAGIVRAHVAAKQVGISFVVGCRVEFGESDRHSVLLYPTDLDAYGQLCTLLTLGKQRAVKGACQLSLHDLIDHHEKLLAVIMPPERLDQAFLEIVEGMRRVFDDDRLSIAASCLSGPDDRSRLDRVARLAAHTGVPLVATNDVHYHIPQRRALQDVLTCIRHGCLLDEAGFRLLPNAERYLKTPREMKRLFAEYPESLTRTIEIAERAGAFSLDELRYQYPNEVCPPGRTPMAHLRGLTWSGAARRYPDGVPKAVHTRIEHEFELIGELEYAPYFLTVHDLVVFARGRGILCQGRGAAANSAVCYCLGVTAVDPDRIDLLFERFVSRERNEPPDIDIDFEHERREEVIQYIYSKYGRERAALAAEVVTYRSKSAIREVGKALGLSLDCVDKIAGNMDWWYDATTNPSRIRELGLDPDDPTMRRLRCLSQQILGFPRHLSQHVGGFVITRTPLSRLVPIENAAMPGRTVIEWDKDDLDAMGMLKVDVLGLGMLTCIRKALEFVNETVDEKLELHSVPPEDPRVYDMVCKADTVGVFQIESRAQMSMLPRLRPRCFYDLVIEVAIVRPGPIQGDMVHPYLRRRNGEEPVAFPDEQVRKVLGKTLGVPLFQEQAMALAIVAAGFTPGEADELRRAMAAWKRKGDQIERFGRRLIAGMIRRGYDRTFAERCFAQIRGFSEYGFPESHAASFALLVYVSSWLKRHQPAAFAAALINSQPMGFYAPAQIVRDAREHGVQVRGIDVNFSAWDCTLEDLQVPGVGTEAARALRLGMRLVKGLRRQDADRISEAVHAQGPFGSIEVLRRQSGVGVAALRKLAGADAFGSLRLDRQAALWQVQALRDEVLPMFEHLEPLPDDASAAGRRRLPHVSDVQKVMHDYKAVRLSLKAHPVSFLRTLLDRNGVTPAVNIGQSQNGDSISVAGIVLVRQRPATASGIMFMTLEDETGITNLIVRPRVFEQYRPAARHGVIVVARGHVERQIDVVHVLVHAMERIDQEMAELVAGSRDFR